MQTSPPQETHQRSLSCRKRLDIAVDHAATARSSELLLMLLLLPHRHSNSSTPLLVPQRCFRLHVRAAMRAVTRRRPWCGISSC